MLRTKATNNDPEPSPSAGSPSIEGHHQDITRQEKLNAQDIGEKRALRSQLHTKEAEITTIREHWLYDLRILHGDIGKLEQTKLELEAKISNLEAAATDVKNAGSDPLVYEIGRKNMEICRLTEKMHQYFEVSSIKEKEVKHLPPPRIDAALNEIRLELEAMTQMQDLTNMLSREEWSGGELGRLVNSAFVAPEGSLEGTNKLRRLGGMLGPSAVFSILAITALRDWVF